MKIKVENEVGRECNPFERTVSLFDGRFGFDDYSNPEWEYFERSVQSFPAPGIADGEHEACLKWQNRLEHHWCDDPSDFEWKDTSEPVIKSLGFEYRQIWKLTPKAK